MKHNSLPFPCASHGELERLEEYCLLFNVDDPNIAQEFFKLANNIVNCNFLKPCPCGSLKMLKDCHGEKLKEVKSYLLSNKE